MQQDANFSVRYLTQDRVPIRDIIESLQGVETIMGEMAHILPMVLDGISVRKVDVKVREISQASPLRELFLVTLVVAYQQQLQDGIVAGVETATGASIPPNMEALVTVLALILVFYGVGAIKDLVTGGGDDGPSKRMLDGLLNDLAIATGKPAQDIRAKLDARYGDKTMWKKIANAASRFFTPSKKQDSAPIEVNDRTIDQEVVRDVPASYIFENEADAKSFRNFEGVALELHAQDRDNAGRGWAAVAKGVSEQRLRLRLMDNISPLSLIHI